MKNKSTSKFYLFKAKIKGLLYTRVLQRVFGDLMSKIRVVLIDSMNALLARVNKFRTIFLTKLTRVKIVKTWQIYSKRVVIATMLAVLFVPVISFNVTKYPANNIIETANAQANRYCTGKYKLVGTGEGSFYNNIARDMKGSFASNKTEVWNNESFGFSLNLTSGSDTNFDKEFTNQACPERFFLRASSGVLGSVKGELDVTNQIQVDQIQSTETGVRMSVKPPEKLIKLNQDNLKTLFGGTLVTQNTTFDITLVSKVITPLPSLAIHDWFQLSSTKITIKPCNNPQGCADHTGNENDPNLNPAIGEANTIDFSSLRFQLTTRVTGPAVPKQVGDSSNFVRTYLKDGRAQGFTVTAVSTMTQPSDKKLSISNSTSDPRTRLSIVKTNKDAATYDAKPSNGFIAGVTKPDKKTPGANTEYGCLFSAVTTSNYTPGTGNLEFKYNFCKFVNQTIKEKIVFEPGKPQEIPISITDGHLINLAARNLPTCYTDEAKTQRHQGNDFTTVKACDNDGKNMLMAYNTLAVEKSLLDDTSIGAQLLTTFSGAATLYGLYNLINNAIDLQVSFIPGARVYVQIYPNEAMFNKYKDAEIPEWVTDPDVVESRSTMQDGQESTLFNFLRKVTAYIVLLITSFIYFVFSVIVLPLLVAVLKIQPYKDSFVNFIYPGWIILRNIANILFIIALLWMGLRTILQLEDSAKSRSFIVKLILMALLVNFSLVIGQAVVGIADTLQAQFLPGDSKVVESLAHKLMVEPIQTFRGVESTPESLNLTDDANFTQDSTASDLPKAIVMMYLALGAFIAFCALIAFIIVRLVALWLLYMISPIAYVANLFSGAEGYLGKWWKEFIKYAFAVPIMAFFLNITALMAVTFARKQGNSVEVDNLGRGLFTGVGGDLAELVITTLSHLIVLVFLFGGMMFAQKFGGAGSEKIVGAAKGAFDALGRKAPKSLGIWAKDNAGEGASNLAKNLKMPRLAAGISALTQPMISTKKAYENLITKPKAKQMERMAKTRKPLDDYTKFFGENKVQGMKMLGYKLTGQGHKALEIWNKQYSEVLTNREREQLVSDQKKLDDKVKDWNEADKNAGFVPLAEADDFIKERERQIKEIDEEQKNDTELQEWQKQRAKAAMDPARQADLTKRIQARNEAYDARRTPLNEQKEKIAEAIDNSKDGRVDLTGTDVSSGEIYDVNINKANNRIADINEKLDKDDELRRDLNIEKWTDDDRQQFLKEMKKLIASRQFPDDIDSMAERLAEEREEMKKYEGIDDPDMLRAIYKKAITDNNTPLATAIAKKIFKEGASKDLINDRGLQNNIDGLRKMVERDMGNLPINIRNQVAAELSVLAKQNKNLAVANSHNIDEEGVLSWNSMETQQAKTAKSASKVGVWARGYDEVFHEKESGEIGLNKGFSKELKRYENNTNAKKKLKETNAKVATELVNMHEMGRLNLGAGVLSSLKAAAGRR